VVLMLDLLLTGGTVIDGTGAPGRVADVGVRDGRVVSVGTRSGAGEPAGRAVDVTGLVVAPGFIDIHTHYDAQLFWDPTASPSPLHGVTTAIGGNCGFSLAPAGAAHADYLMRMMARVEGMPLAALEAGLPWDWGSFAEWMSRLDGAIGINAGFLCGHSALRRVAMGDDAVGSRASEAQLAAMLSSLHDALDAGAMGFSTSTAPTHNDGAQQPVPSRAATREELVTLAGAARDHPGTTLEVILAGCLNGFTDDEVDLMTTMSLAANRPVNWNVLGVNALNPEAHWRQLDASTRAAERGARVVALTLPHATGVRLSFLTGFVFDGLPGWAETMAMPVDARVRALSDSGVRARLAAGASSEEAGVLRGLANWANLRIDEVHTDALRSHEGRLVGEIATEQGHDPFDVLLDIVIADGLRTGLRPALRDDPKAWELKLEVWRDGRTIVGGSDAGAHLDMMCGAVYSTAMLAGVRERGGIALEEAVQLLSGAPARFYGLRDRGRVVEGGHADLVVFDPSTIGPGPERTRADLPGGASRLFATSTGVERVYVNGVGVVEDGRITGATPGTLLRSGRDTDSVTVPGG
jgi:N-acyl-D-aspartate/D-glutamate deacylase